MYYNECFTCVEHNRSIRAIVVANRYDIWPFVATQNDLGPLRLPTIYLTPYVNPFDFANDDTFDDAQVSQIRVIIDKQDAVIARRLSAGINTFRSTKVFVHKNLKVCSPSLCQSSYSHTRSH